MEIIRNSTSPAPPPDSVADPVSSVDTGSSAATPAQDAHRITSITQGKKNPNRVNIMLDDKYAFSLALDQLIDFKLKIGQQLTDQDVARYQQASNFGKLYQTTLNWLFLRPHSVKETRDYLKRKQFSNKEYHITDEDIDLIIDKLLAKNYLNDYSFTEYYLETRFQSKGVSRRRLELELRHKGIKDQIITEALEAIPRNDADEIEKVIARKINRYPTDQKLLSYLTSQGFDYDLARLTVQRYRSKLANPTQPSSEPPASF